jgi:hypothetical protein
VQSFFQSDNLFYPKPIIKSALVKNPTNPPQANRPPLSYRGFRQEPPMNNATIATISRLIADSNKKSTIEEGFTRASLRYSFSNKELRSPRAKV